MKCRGFAFALTVALAGCSGGDAVPDEREPPAAEAVVPVPVTGPERRILAFGDSLFAGYNVAEGESYPAQLEAVLRGQGVNARVTNAGVSGDTSAAARQRVGFVLDEMGAAPDLAIVEFGGNDLLRGLPPSETRANLDAILTELGRRDIPVLLMGMRAPPNLGADYVREFDGIYPDLARQHGAHLVPFFLEAVYDQPQWIQSDRIHPTAQGIAALVGATADEVAQTLPKPG